ncbi:MAG: hypothetical protein ACKOTZ_09115 [Chloroflexota bacterium]
MPIPITAKMMWNASEGPIWALAAISSLIPLSPPAPPGRTATLAQAARP